jgi:Phytanoyl-CoA dioxygenase (PhyH)
MLGEKLLRQADGRPYNRGVDTLRTPKAAPRPSPSQVAKFADEGYIVLRHFLRNVGEINDVIESIARANAAQPIFMRYAKQLSLAEFGYTYEDFATKSASLRIPEIHRISSELRRLVDDYGFEAYLAAYLADTERVDLLQSLYFPFSSNQASHSDKFLVSPPSVPYRRETLFGVWFALDGTTQVNGALFGWTGSHKVPDKPLLSDYTGYGDYSRDLAVMMVNHGIQPHFIYAEPGDVVLWASDFVHGGARPLSAEVTRRALVLHYGARIEG